MHRVIFSRRWLALGKWRPWGAAAAGLLLAAVLPPRAGGVEILPTGFSVTPVVGPPFDGAPVGFAFLPDGRILIVEQLTAKIRIAPVAAGHSVAIHTVPNVETAGGERGLIGVTVDPEWPARPYVYVCYTHVGGVIYLTMYTAFGDLTNPASSNLTLGSPYHLLTDLPDINEVHNCGTVRFGTDGMLLMGIGDDQGPCGAQNLNVPVGKIFRLDVSNMPGEGSGPPPKSALVAPGHPFDTGDNARLVAAWGLRNPFRFTVDAPTGTVVIGDVGRHVQEEVDLLFPASLGPNYGWPQLEGTSNPMCCGSCGIGNVFTAPIYTYPHSSPPNVVVPGPILRSGASPIAFPAAYDGDLFVIEFFGGWIRRLTESGGNWTIAPSVPGQPNATNWALGFPWIGDAQLGPDGGLYVLQMYGPGPVGIRRIAVTAVDAVVNDAPISDGLEVWPSPARIGERVSIRWSTPGAGARLTVRDVAGRVVRSLAAADESGRVEWDGRTESGALVSAGTYFVRAEASGRAASSAKIVLLR